MKSDEKVPNHVLYGSDNKPAGGAVAIIYPCPPESNVWMSYGQLGGSVIVFLLLLVPFIRVAATSKNGKT